MHSLFDKNVNTDNPEGRRRELQRQKDAMLDILNLFYQNNNAQTTNSNAQKIINHLRDYVYDIVNNDFNNELSLIENKYFEHKMTFVTQYISNLNDENVEIILNPIEPFDVNYSLFVDEEHIAHSYKDQLIDNSLGLLGCLLFTLGLIILLAVLIIVSLVCLYFFLQIVPVGLELFALMTFVPFVITLLIGVPLTMPFFAAGEILIACDDNGERKSLVRVDKLETEKEMRNLLIECANEYLMEPEQLDYQIQTVSSL